MLGIFNVHRDVNACDIASRGCTDTDRRSALKVDSWRKIPCCTRQSDQSQQHASPTHYQLNHIPSPGMAEHLQMHLVTVEQRAQAL